MNNRTGESGYVGIMRYFVGMFLRSQSQRLFKVCIMPWDRCIVGLLLFLFECFKTESQSCSHPFAGSIVQTTLHRAGRQISTASPSTSSQEVRFIIPLQCGHSQKKRQKDHHIMCLINIQSQSAVNDSLEQCITSWRLLLNEVQVFISNSNFWLLHQSCLT